MTSLAKIVLVAVTVAVVPFFAAEAVCLSLRLFFPEIDLFLLFMAGFISCAACFIAIINGLFWS